MKFIPVLDINNEPLMPCSPARARKLIKSRKAKKKWLKNIFHIQLIDRKKEDSSFQKITMGVDPGSKFEGFTVASEKHVYPFAC